MINHARTLLLNQPAQFIGHYADTAEYIPPTFTPVVLSQALSFIRNVLFGTTTDAYFVQFRVRELLRYIHETEFSSYLYALDSRVTYWPEQPTITPSHYLSVQQTFGVPHVLGISKIVTPTRNDRFTAGQYEVALTRNDETGASVVDVRPRELAALPTTTTFAAGVVPGFQLPGITANFLLNGVATTPPEYPVGLTEIDDMLILEEYAVDTSLGLASRDDGATMEFRRLSLATTTAKWIITAKTRPASAITSILPALELIGEPVFLELFGVSDKEPYTTFKNLWSDHPLPVYRLVGFVLAFIYRVHERSTKNGS